MQFRRLLLNIFILYPFLTAAQPHHSFNSFNKEDGLTSSTIQDMVQDRNGFLWLASWGGLYRFDGERFVNFRANIPDEQGDPRSNRFIQIATDGSGRIWALAYDSALYYFDSGETDLHLAETPGSPVTKLYPLNGGRICMATSDNTLLFPQENGTGTAPDYAESRLVPADVTLNAVHQDRQGYLWLLTDGGLYREGRCLDPSPAFCAFEADGHLYVGSSEGRVLDIEGMTVSTRQTRFRSDLSLVCKSGISGELIVGSTAEGILVLQANTVKDVFAGQVSYVSSSLRSVSNSQGDLWIYSEAGGLDWYDPERRCLVPFFNPAKQQGWNFESRIACVLPDSQDDLWISSALGGLEEVVFSRDPFKFHSFAPKGYVSSSSSVRALSEYQPGQLLIGTRDGRIQLTDTTFRVLTQWDLPAPPYAITRSSEGGIWIGTRAEGLFEITPDGQKKAYRKNDDYYGANADHIYGLHEDDNRRLWIASFDSSLSYLDLSQEARAFISKKNRLSFPSEERNRLRYVTVGENGTLYAGGDLGLFCCKNPEADPEQMQFIRFSRIRNYDIQNILFSRTGQLYVCSYGNGFLAFDTPEPDSAFTEYTVEDGLLSNFIIAAVEDENGIIWITTEGGLNRFNPASGNIVGYSYERLGFPMRFNEGPILKASDGKLYFNTNAGVFHFDPAQIAGNSYVPQLQLLSCQAGKRLLSTSLEGPVRLRAGEQLKLEFTAIDMAAPGHVHYAYRIDGTDSDWVAIGTQNELTLGPFRRGRHQIRLRSTNGAGVTVDNVRLIEVQAAPHPLASTWALVFYAICAAAALIWFLLRHPRRTDALPNEENPYLRGLSGDDRKLVESLLALLENKLDDGALDMDAMAEAMHLSRSALFKKTKALTGKSPMDLLREMRFERARDLVTSGGYTIAQIAYMTGFNDSHYFSKSFKKQFGLTPTEYRNRQQAGD